MPTVTPNTSTSTSTPPKVSPETRMLAWSGWQMQVPANWHPIKIEGEFTKGTMFVGDGTGPYMMVKWWRPRMEGLQDFSMDDWLKHRFKKLHAQPQPHPPTPSGFDRTAWVKDLQTKEKKSRTIWYGYVEAAETVVEVLMTSLTPEAVRNRIEQEVLPSLELSAKKDPILWSLFTASFVSPPGFILESHHLMSGDIALRLVNDKDILTLRTVYPADLALSRRKLPDWLDHSPFLERRKNRETSVNKWRSDAPRLNGLLRTGWKRLPFPLGWLKPLYCTSIGAVDPELDRLALVDHRSPDPNDSHLAKRAAEQINWDSDV